MSIVNDIVEINDQRYWWIIIIDYSHIFGLVNIILLSNFCNTQIKKTLNESWLRFLALTHIQTVIKYRRVERFRRIIIIDIVLSGAFGYFDLSLAACVPRACHVPVSVKAVHVLNMFARAPTQWWSKVKWSSNGRTELAIHFQPGWPTPSECFSYPYTV